MGTFAIISIVICLLVLSALCSGLTLGMMSLNISELERKVNLGDKDAVRVLKVRRKGSLLLCALLLSNTAVNATISVFLGNLTTGVIAGATATLLIVIFGEITPQALFSREPLKYGARMAWLVEALMWISWLVSKPVSMFIDFIFGKELPTRWDKKEITEIIKTHENGPIDSDEKRIILGALSFSDKRAKDVMTPRTVLFAIDKDRIIDHALLSEIREQGFSRVPVFDGTQDHVVGVLYVKKLIGSQHILGKTINELCDKDQVLSYRDDTKLDLILNNLLKTKKHISFVFDEYGTLKGIVTMEDVMEEVIGAEILDESDDVPDMQVLARDKIKNKFNTSIL